MESGIIPLVMKSHAAHISWNSCNVGAPNGVLDIADAGDRSSLKLNGGRSSSQREKPESGSVQRLNGRRLVSTKRRFASLSLYYGHHFSVCFSRYRSMESYLTRNLNVHKLVLEKRKLDL